MTPYIDYCIDPRPGHYTARITSLNLDIEVQRPFSSYSALANFGPKATNLHIRFTSSDPETVLDAAKRLLLAGVARRAILASAVETHAQELANLLRAAALALS